MCLVTPNVNRDEIERTRYNHCMHPTLRVRYAANEHFLDVPIGDDWIATYRLAFGGRPRRARIMELRISYTGKRRNGQFSFERLRRLTERGFVDALASTVQGADSRALEIMKFPTARLVRPKTEGRGAGRPGLSRKHYAEVAVRYHAIEHDENREPRSSTRELLRKRYYPKATPAMIGKWLTTAGKHGFLTPVARGSRHRYATATARAFVKQPG